MNIQKTAMTGGTIQASKGVVTLCITILCATTLWTGVLEIEHRSGLADQLAGRMGLVLAFFSPRLDPDGKTRKQISVNVTANMLGLGWAVTPARLKAMEELKEMGEEYRKEGATRQKDTSGQEDTTGQRAAARRAGTASNEMCTFLIISIFSLQLMPVNIIVCRSQYGSVNPTAVMGPALTAAFISTMVAVIFCRVMNRQVWAMH